MRVELQGRGRVRVAQKGLDGFQVNLLTDEERCKAVPQVVKPELTPKLVRDWVGQQRYPLEMRVASASASRSCGVDFNFNCGSGIWTLRRCLSSSTKVTQKTPQKSLSVGTMLAGRSSWDCFVVVRLKSRISFCSGRIYASHFALENGEFFLIQYPIIDYG